MAALLLCAALFVVCSALWVQLVVFCLSDGRKGRELDVAVRTGPGTCQAARQAMYHRFFGAAPADVSPVLACKDTRKYSTNMFVLDPPRKHVG